jgi:hypothetical protein
MVFAVSFKKRFQVSGFGCQKTNDTLRNQMILDVIQFVFLTPDT